MQAPDSSASELESAEDFNAAAHTLYRYLHFRPDDGPAHVLLAQVFDKVAETTGAKNRAAEHYYAALAIYPDRVDLRTRLAEILFELNRLRDAQKECLRVLFDAEELPVTEIVARLKRFEDGLSAAKLLEEKPESAKALSILAQVRFEIGFTERDWSPVQQLVAR